MSCIAGDPRIICPSEELSERGSYSFGVVYRGEPSEAILVRFRGNTYGYLNQCVHMLKELDCRHSHIFDETGEFLRCSMHGITYDPATGRCQSEICRGKALTALKVSERNGCIYLDDKRSRISD